MTGGAFDGIAFPSFLPLLEACEDFSKLSGGRYTKAMVSDLRGDDSEHDRARVQAMPAIAAFADRLAAKGGRAGAGSEVLLQEFHAAEVMVAREAVFRSMQATCRAVDLWPSGADVAADDITYQDTSEPLETIAQRLYNFVRCRADEGEEERHNGRMLAASFIVEFCREHGAQPGEPDGPSERMLMEFLQRAKEWGERQQLQDLVPCLDPLPDGLRKKAETWWKRNWRGIAIGTGLLVAGAGILAGGLALLAAQRRRDQEGGSPVHGSPSARARR